MSITLGEKLRQAREERGISISEVAEQTRISALYIESIEKDDYRNLPGGIFNKGFVKSFAKYVGIDEQEALQDYARLIASQGSEVADEPKTYRPEVLTDDRPSSSKFTTIIFAGVILSLMVAGVLMLVRYIEPIPSQPIANTTSNANANANAISNIDLANTNTAPQQTISTNNFKVEIKAINSPVSLVSTADGQKASSLLEADKSKVFELKEGVRFSYSKAKAANVQITINDKQITPPKEPQSANRGVIEFEINKNNLQKFWESGQITYEGMPSPR
jgi:cytoskeletal protein RodZ